MVKVLSGIDLYIGISKSDWEIQAQSDRRHQHPQETQNFRHPGEANPGPNTEASSKLLHQTLPSLLSAAGVFALWPSQKKRRAAISRCRKHTMYSGGHSTVKF